jgi:hypothetical protein
MCYKMSDARHKIRLIYKLGTVHPYGINERFSYFFCNSSVFACQKQTLTVLSIHTLFHTCFIFWLTKGLCSKRQNSPYIFQVVASLPSTNKSLYGLTSWNFMLSQLLPCSLRLPNNFYEDWWDFQLSRVWRTHELMN